MFHLVQINVQHKIVIVSLICTLPEVDFICKNSPFSPKTQTLRKPNIYMQLVFEFYLLYCVSWIL